MKFRKERRFLKDIDFWGVRKFLIQKDCRSGIFRASTELDLEFDALFIEPVYLKKKSEYDE
jgi:hypothetical protein